MRKLEGDLREYYAYDIVRLGGRLLRFSRRGGRLLVIELTLGEEVQEGVVSVSVNGLNAQNDNPSVCQLDDKALVMFGNGNIKNVFAALVTVGPGQLRQGSIHVKTLQVKGLESWRDGSYLSQIGENKILASFLNSDEVWICEVKESILEWTKSSTKLPTSSGFGAPPFRLPDGRLLAAGTWPTSTSIYLVIPGSHIFFEKIGNFPGAGRYAVSTVLFGDRFVIGFGGWAGTDRDDMWIFDLETRKSSSIAKRGQWHPATSWPILEVQDNTLYIIGGRMATTSAYSIPLVSLLPLIQDEAIRTSLFRCEDVLHLPSAEQLTCKETICVIHFLRAFLRDPRSKNASLSSELAAALVSKWEEEVSEEFRLASARNVELWAARSEIAALREEISRLQAEVKRVTPPPGTLLVPLPFKDLPPLRLPQKWRINQKKLAGMNTAMEVHRSALPRRGPAPLARRRAFRPEDTLLDSEAPAGARGG